MWRAPTTIGGSANGRSTLLPRSRLHCLQTSRVHHPLPPMPWPSGCSTDRSAAGRRRAQEVETKGAGLGNRLGYLAVDGSRSDIGAPEPAAKPARWRAETPLE